MIGLEDEVTDQSNSFKGIIKKKTKEDGEAQGRNPN